MLVFVLWGSCTKTQERPLRIATAANMQFAIDALVSAFEDSTQISCEIILGSSGKLTAQILQGAPYDVFLSADMKYPEHLKEKEKIDDLFCLLSKTRESKLSQNSLFKIDSHILSH